MSDAASGGLRRRTLDALSWDEAADAFTRCYEGYVIPVRASGADLAARCHAEDVDAGASCVLDDGAGPAGISLMARRGRRARLAAFAVAPRLRGEGLARSMLARMVEESEARRDTTFELEVFEHNAAAVRLYERAGFVPIERLVGFEHDARPATARRVNLSEVPLAELAAGIAADPASGLPWQLEAGTVARMPAPWQVVGDPTGAMALVDMSRDDAVHLRLIFTPPPLRRAGHARRLTAAILDGTDGRPVRVPQLVPGRNMDIARRLGFRAAGHGQLRMVRRNSGIDAL